ncbi:hypothetical protein KAI92_04170, partial [Candidatus Parcubacteria bacterium]|nr:hypothetical protein [Candidatus Parcubacteria bacterium]
MKNFFRGKITFTKFLIGIFCLFFLVILINVGKFFWESYDISQQNITILTQSEFSLGGTGSLQVFVRNIDKNENIKDGEIDLFLNKTPTKGENGSVDKLFTGNFIDGYLSTSFKLPDFLNVGEYELVIDVKSKFGKDKIKKSIKISSNSKLVISTDRPLYKPGQDMNFRVLLLDKSSLKPFSSKDLQISVVNPNGDKIFQKNYKTSEYGIASDNFSFANKLAFGEYKITVNADKATGEKIVNVKEFTLPKFEISILPDQDLTKVEDRVSGKILAKYFFGKPLVNADVKLKVDIDGRKHFLIDKTNDEGILKFDFDLFRKKEINQILINVEVVDANKNTIIAQKVATVAQKDIVVELIPESGKLKPGLENEILFISSRSDGTPVKTSIFMTGERIREFATNEYGIAKFKYKPDENSSLSRFTLTVKDEQGNVLKKPFSLQNEMGDSGHLILRTDKTFFEGNSKIKLDILSTRDVATQVEFIQDNCIVHTESFDLQDGKISKEIELPEHIFGTVEMRAIQTVQNTSISNNRRYNNKSNINVNFATDSKIILVDRPKNLQVEIELDKNTYLPGSEAKVSFKVQDENGNLENSALGIKIVDEALLALEDDNENLNKLLFLVDNKIHENAKSINGLTWNKTLEDDTLKIKDSILQAMFVDVPRSKISFSRIEKNNYDVWRDYKNSKNNLFRSAFLFLFFIIFVFALKFLWNITELSAKKNATLKIWGGSFIVSILTISVGTLFVKSANRYYDFGDKVGDVFSFFIEDIFFKIIEKPVLFYFILILIVLLAGSIYIAYQRKNQLIEIKSLLTSFFILFGSLTFFSILEYFDIGISSIFHNDTWQAFAMFLLSILILGAINYFIVKSLKDNEFIITSWLLVLLIGIISLMFVPMMIIIYIILLLFGFIRLSKNNSNISDDELKLLELEVKLKEKDDVNEVSRMELILLRRDIEQKKRSSVVVSIILIIISVLTLLWLNKIMLYQEFLQLIFSLPFVAIIFGSIWKLIDPENKKRFNGKTLVSAGLISILIIIVFIIIFGFLRVSMQSSIRNSNIPDRWSKGTSFGGTSIDSVSSGFGMEHYAESTNLGSANPMAMPSFSGILDKFDGSGTKNKKVISDTNEQEIVFNDEVKEKKEEFKKAKRVRKFFPETMFWNSEIIAENGLASLIIPVKDSITKWRLSALANSLSGKVGSADKNLVTFQDFFIDFDLPANLTKGDELTIPVSVFNYLEESQKIKMVVKDGSWFELLNDKENIIELNSNEVKTFYVKIQLLKHGDFVLRIDGQGTKQADAVEKILTVLPFGQRITQTIASEKLNMDLTELQAIFPNERIEGTEKV